MPVQKGRHITYNKFKTPDKGDDISVKICLLYSILQILH